MAAVINEKKQASKVVKPTKKTIRERPSIVKKSPEEELFKLLKSSFDSKSPLFQAFQNKGLITALEQNADVVKQQQNILQHNMNVSKQLTRALIANSSKLSFVIQAFEKNNKEKSVKKDEKLDNILKSSSQTTKELTKNVKSVYDFLKETEKRKQEKEIEQDVHEFKTKLEEERQKELEKNNEKKKWFSKPSYEPSQLEKKTSQLFGKGFHYITGTANELLQKKILKTKAVKGEQGVSESEEHKSYVNTKNQIQNFPKKVKDTYDIIVQNIKQLRKQNIPVTENKSTPVNTFLKNVQKPTESKIVRELQPRDSETGKFVKKEETLEKTIQKGDTKIISSIDKVHGVLQVIANYFTNKIEIEQEQKDEDAEKLPLRDKLGKFVKTEKVTDEKESSTEKSSSIFDKAKGLLGKGLLGKGGKLLGRLGGAGSAAEGGAAIEGGGATLGAIALPVAGVLASAAGGYAAGTYINKKLWKKTNAQEKESQDAYAEQQERVKKDNPEAIELAQTQKRIRQLEAIPKKSPQVQAEITRLKEQYSETLQQNAEKKNAAATQPTISKAENAPKSTTPTIEKAPVQSVVSSKTSPANTKPPETSPVDNSSIISELKNGNIYEILMSIRDHIQNLQPSAGGNKVGLFNLSDNQISMSKSNISLQREGMRMA